MSHFFVVPTNANGLILDTQIADDIATALAKPFFFQDIFLYAHGWWTTEAKALQDYNQFTIGFARRVLGSLAVNDAPADALAIGLQWPSTLTDRQSAIGDLLEPATFYGMETRANSIGTNAGYALLRCIVENKPPRRRINLIGHSFGCKVVCSLLESLQLDLATVQVPADTEINVVLLQAAFDNDDLEPGNIYGQIADVPNLRLLVTTSKRDNALRVFYPTAEALNFFKVIRSPRVALGFDGPSHRVVEKFAPVERVSVGPGFSGNQILGNSSSKMVIADLTDLHDGPGGEAFKDQAAGHHNDVFRDEIYSLIAAFVERKETKCNSHQ